MKNLSTPYPSTIYFLWFITNSLLWTLPINASIVCDSPTNLLVENVSVVSASISWTPVEGAVNYIVAYKKEQEEDWVNATVAATAFTLSNLQSCTKYDYKVAANCGGEISDFSQVSQFQTEGCCVPPNEVTLATLTATQATVFWSEVVAASSYIVSYRVVGTTAWISQQISANQFTFPVESCEAYEVKLSSNCVTGTMSEDAEMLTFTSKGCGFCLDVTHCESYGQNTDSEWIENIAIGNFSNISENNDGYAGFYPENFSLKINKAYPITLTPAFNGIAFEESWAIWVDLNQDGNFNNETERIFAREQASNVIESEIFIPTTAVLGETRMRISMQFGELPLPCELVGFGEVEDYCVTILPNECTEVANLTLEEITETNAFISWENDGETATTFEVDIRETTATAWETVTTTELTQEWTTLSPCQSYVFRVRSNCNGIYSEYSATQSFTTKGCGACFDNDYCVSFGENSQNEWIESIQIGTFSNLSANNGGYGNYENSGLSLHRGSTYPITLTPGFFSDAYFEYWRIWIDFNQNGIFDNAQELVFDIGTFEAGEVNSMITIPLDIMEGDTKLRVSMQFNDPMSSCGQLSFGEVEDYCLEILPELCNTPADINVIEVIESTAIISWASTVNCVNYLAQFRAVGETDWTVIQTTDTILLLENLIAGQSYEFQVSCTCETQEANFSEPISFTTLQPACESVPVNLQTSNITHESATLIWQKSTDCSTYTILYREQDTVDWIETETTDTMIVITNLIAGSDYEFQVSCTCAFLTSNFSESMTFTTLPSVGIENIQQFPMAYPNPFTTYIQLDNHQQLIETIQLMTVTGQITKQYSPTSNVMIKINTTDLPSGIYYLLLHTKDTEKPAVQKLVKLVD